MINLTFKGVGGPVRGGGRPPPYYGRGNTDMCTDGTAVSGFGGSFIFSLNMGVGPIFLSVLSKKANNCIS